MNALQKLHDHGQSFWLDFIRRDMFGSGELKRMVREQGLRGMTSNPTIFEKAIAATHEYDAQLKKEAGQKKSIDDIFEAIAVSDIQKAADVLRPVYQSSRGLDGFVSLEVSPRLAYDTKGTLQNAKHLWKKVGRANLMIKIPGTQEGLPAIEEGISAGLNINITLLFSVENYKQVVEAYLKGLERRVRRGLPIRHMASVASFFVSRVDTAIDKILDEKISSNAPDKDRAQALLHKAAIANAKIAYAYYEEIIKSPRFQKLKEKGAQPQRLLWASTGTKDKRLSDVIYVEELIGPDTVNTMPPQTAEAFNDHGVAEERLTQNLDDAYTTITALEDLGVDLKTITDQLQLDGVKLFSKSFDDLLHGVGVKRELLNSRSGKKVIYSLGHYENSFKEALEKIEKENWISRIWAKDASVWKNDEAHQKIIRNSLGWLNVVQAVESKLPLLNAITADIRKGKFTHILLLGMGGSSLAPEVLRLTFGKKTGYPDLAILDSTEPASVIERIKRSKPAKTLYIVASKSGSTTEPNAFLAAFYDLVKKERGAKAGENFIAITDPGTQMEAIAKEKKFRHIILNPSDIGGRYSALSFFGMVPGALSGCPVKAILDSAQRMAYSCAPQVPLENNPGAVLGAALGSLANRGRNKVTFFLSPDIASFSTWVEQLIAESTGKEGVGILPIESEPLEKPEYYGQDRVFISIATTNTNTKALDKNLKTLEQAGHPVIRMIIGNKTDIGGEFFRWEIATAVAGGLLGIDPFDQPNVQESKDLTKHYIDAFKSTGSLGQAQPSLEQNGIAVFSTNGASHAPSLAEALKIILNEISEGDYVALLAYIARTPENEKILQGIRETILKAKKVATTIGFGPRFLHSTGQLHKGGADNGVFIQITADDAADWPVPGEPYTFSVLKEAQALGDLSALNNKKRRTIRLHLKNLQQGLKEIQDTLNQLQQN